RIALLSKVYPIRSHSGAAQGGIAASLGNAGADALEWHVYDTIKGSDFLADHDAAELLCKSAAETVLALEKLGVPFSRTADGRIGQRTFGGHTVDFGKKPALRACYAADRTGHAVLTTLFEQCARSGVVFFSEFYLLALDWNNERCSGLAAWDMQKGGIHRFDAAAVLLATGGYGRIFAPSTNALINTGDGQAAVLRAGMPLEDMEFVQFHPTSLADKGILITEAARAEGGFLLNGNAERFMNAYAPRQMELATRDVVTRAIIDETRAGRGINGSDFVHLDIRHLGEAIINEKLSQTREICIKFAGIDPVFDKVPVRPAAHYSMGGIPVSLRCEVLRARGLYAAGECACVSVHGANRLGCNSLLEAAVFGHTAGVSMDTFLTGQKYAPCQADAAVKAAVQELAALEISGGSESVADIRESLQRLMSAKCGVYRNSDTLISLHHDLARLRTRYQSIRIEDRSPVFNLNLIETLELGRMLDIAEAVAHSAQARTESRGSHARTDFPKRNDREWHRHTLITKQGDCINLRYKPVCPSPLGPG
nr:FAD-binding protein [Chitinispirillaceae bacterium]